MFKVEKIFLFQLQKKKFVMFATLGCEYYEKIPFEERQERYYAEKNFKVINHAIETGEDSKLLSAKLSNPGPKKQKEKPKKDIQTFKL